MDSILHYDKNEEDDYYAILGCDEHSSTEQIVTEYKVRAMKLHPDKNPEDTSVAAKFQTLQVAKSTLTDPNKRKEYDTWRRSGITVPYKQWQAMRDSMHTSMHWVTPNTKDRMITPSEAPAGVHQPPQLSGASGESPRVTWSADSRGWQRENNLMLNKFRNYQI